MSLHSCALSTCINKELKNKNKKLLKNWQKKKILNPVCNRNFSCAANQHGVLEEAGTVLECERVSGATLLISSSPIVKKKKHTKVLTGCQLSVPFFSLKKTYLEVFNNVTRLEFGWKKETSSSSTTNRKKLNLKKLNNRNFRFVCFGFYAHLPVVVIHECCFTITKGVVLCRATNQIAPFLPSEGELALRK